MLSSPSATDLPHRDRILITACIGLVLALAWAYLVHLDREMSATMDYHAMMEGMGMPMDQPWASADVFYTFAMWVVMMVGMMAGSAVPVLLLFAGSRAKRPQHGARLATLMFGLGYLLVWVGYSAVATLAQWGLREAALLSPMMAASSPYVGGAILFEAGLYQLTAWKRSCLTHCRSPLGFLMSNWRDGQVGALRMGLQHGAYCLGCCWMLMMVLFTVGVMNLMWVAALTALVLLEKVGPSGMLVSRVAGGIMLLAGIRMVAMAIWN
jgi:predicted metal-binding membrane protein